eukprot:jgi/Bigna1/139544/aug1.51_g14252
MINTEGCGYEELKTFVAEKFQFSNPHQIIISYMDQETKYERFISKDEDLVRAFSKNVSKLALEVYKREDNDGKKLLYEVQNCEVSEVAKTLKLNGKLDYEDSKGVYPLGYAISRDKDVLVKMLLEAKAPVDHISKDGQFPLNVAVFNGNIELSKLLIEAKANVNLSAKNDNGIINGALKSAVGLRGDVELVKMLLEAKADPKGTKEDRITPLIQAQMSGKEEFVALLKKHGA